MTNEAPKLTHRPEVVALVPRSLAREVEAFPIGLSEDTITFAVAAPLSPEIRDKLRFLLDREFREEIHPIGEIRRALDEHYSAASEIIFYYPGTAEIRDEGTIEMGASGWEDGMHWSGWKSFSPDDSDYGLWRWVISQGDRFAVVVGPGGLGGIIEGYQGLDVIREEYQRTA